MFNKKFFAAVLSTALIVGTVFSVYGATPGNTRGNRNGEAMGMNQHDFSTDSDRNRPPMPPKGSNSMNGMPGNPPQMKGHNNTTGFGEKMSKGESPMDNEITEQIESVSDSETKEKLTSLYEMFKEAMEKEHELLVSGSSDSDELSSAKKAVRKTMDALIEAFKDAGLEMSRPEAPEDGGSGDE